MAGELTTVNYGWIKPTVDGSDDAWGGYINTDLDGIDTIVKGVSVVANAAYPASNPSGYQTAAQVAAVVIGDNRIINGDMRIDQRNAGAAGTANGYTVDRWQYQGSQATKGNWVRSSAAAALQALGFGYTLSFVSTSAYALIAGDYFLFSQPIEADMVSDFAWGTASAKSVTLSFLVLSTLTGTFGGALNGSGGRSYPFTYSIPAANTWTKIVVTIPGDTAGTWTLSGNAASVTVVFGLGVGSTYSGPANAWAWANYFSANGAVSVVGINGAQWLVTGVKLEIGSVATPFNRQSLAKSMADCERYFRWVSLTMQFYATVASQSLQTPVSFPAMRATPTMSAISADPNTTQSNTNNSGNSITPQAPYGGVATLQAAATGPTLIVGYRASASAEL